MAVETIHQELSSSQKEFESLLNEDFKDRKLKEGEIIKATVTEITKNFIVCDVKAKMEGMIPIEEFKNDPNFSLITGTEMFLPETIMYGGDGAVAGGANFFPRLFVDLYDASVANDTETIARLREKVLKLYDTIYDTGEFVSRFIKGTKSALKALGVCEDYMAMPLRNFDDENRAIIKKYVEEYEYTH